MSSDSWSPGWPRFFWSHGVPIIYQVLVEVNGSPEILEAYIDASDQYMADGLQWRHVDNRETVPKWRVKGWRECPNELNPTT